MSEAVSVAVWSADRLPVEMLNVAEIAFAGTVSDPGAVTTVAALLESVTTEPPEGATFDSVTVQVALPFAPRALGVHSQ